MGKKQHQKDKLYITSKEWKEEWGGKKEDTKAQAKFRRLPFNCCSLSFQPFENPLCTKEGIIYDLLSIVPYLKKYGRNPVTGEPLTAKQLTKLHFHKNAEGKYHCPVTYKVFTENTHIVAIKTSGNVYAFEAVEKLNLKVKNFKDLLTDEEFTKKDIITIQDPTNLDKFNIASFHHVKNGFKVVDEEEEKAKKDPKYILKKANLETESTLAELEASYKEPEWMKPKQKVKEKVTDRNAAHFSTGAMAGSFTSTAQDPNTKQEADAIDEDILRYAKVKKKGYVRFTTSHGDINLELHCEMVTKTCENFLLLCKRGYYDNTSFHRLIRNFMIQGGDPTGSGKGGESAWNAPFKDQFKPNLSHQGKQASCTNSMGRGILSMANSGPNTNGSQFFITFRSCQHLDSKHTIFGRVVGGLDTLTSMESVATDDKDRPQVDIKIVKTTIFVNPFDEAEEELAAEKEREEQDRLRAEDALKPAKNVKKRPSDEPLRVYRPGVGKYIPTLQPSTSKPAIDEEASSSQTAPKKKLKAKGQFGDFSSW